MPKKRDTSWGKVAPWYDKLLEDSPDTYQAKVILPALLRILEPHPGRNILDVACGQGFFSRALAAHGAKVVGVDISEELVSLARKNSPASISYHTAPANHLAFAKDAEFNAAIIILAVQNIEDLSGTLKECARVLKPGGELVLVMNHPAFRNPQRSSWGFDDAAKVQYRRVDAYLSEARTRIEMHPGAAAGGKTKEADISGATTVSFHRPLQTYFKALAKTGFCITRLEEWNSHRKSQPGPRAKAEDRARKEIPLFLMLQARKND